MEQSTRRGGPALSLLGPVARLLRPPNVGAPGSRAVGLGWSFTPSSPESLAGGMDRGTAQPRQSHEPVPNTCPRVSAEPRLTPSLLFCCGVGGLSRPPTSDAGHCFAQSRGAITRTDTDRLTGPCDAFAQSEKLLIGTFGPHRSVGGVVTNSAKENASFPPSEGRCLWPCRFCDWWSFPPPSFPSCPRAARSKGH